MNTRDVLKAMQERYDREEKRVKREIVADDEGGEEALSDEEMLKRAVRNGVKEALKGERKRNSATADSADMDDEEKLLAEVVRRATSRNGE